VTAVLRQLARVTIAALCVLHAQARQKDAPTLRQTLARAGFSDGASAAGAHDLDRALTSSQFATSPDSVVVAYYFADESLNQVPGPLHVSRVDRQSTRWNDAMPVDSEMGGSISSVAVSERYVIIELHWNPSAGQGVVLDARTLTLLGTFEGFGAHELHDGLVVHTANAIHFAPVYQGRLVAFQPRLKQRAEIFPGPRDWPAAAGYRRKVREAYARLSQEQRAEVERSAYGPINDFDRSLGPLVDAADGRTIAFIATYYATRLDRFAHLAPAQTVVRCRRDAAWSCDENSVEEAARTTTITLPRTDDGRYEPAGLERLLRAFVVR